MIELVVFDLAGTTVYDGDAVGSVFRAALATRGLAADPEAVNAVMGLPKPEAIRRLLPRGRAAAARAQQVSAVHEDFLARMLGFYRTDPAVREVPGASEAFRLLRGRGVRVALDTGFSRPIADAVLERLGWGRGLLDATVTSDEVAHGRPYPDMIYKAMALTGVTDAARVAKVGDTPADLREGHAAGCGWVVGVTAGSHTRAELLTHPHTHLIETVADLPPLLFAARVGAEERGA